jgi:hypothetical protein
MMQLRNTDVKCVGCAWQNQKIWHWPATKNDNSFVRMEAKTKFSILKFVTALAYDIRKEILAYIS